MADRDKALEDYKAGLSYKEIAEKHNVSESTVKSWASRHWNNDKKIQAARKRSKKSQLKGKKSRNQNAEKKSQKDAPKPRGAPHGNKNAAGNNGGAPKGSKNALKHGGYSVVKWDELTEDERAMAKEMEDTDTEDNLHEEVVLYTIRERRILRAINNIKEEVNLKGNVEISTNISVYTEGSGSNTRIKGSTKSTSAQHAFRNFKRVDNQHYVNCAFLLKDLLEETHQMNPTQTNSGGWKATPMRTWLNTRVLNALPIMWQQIIQTVYVNSNTGYQATTIVDPPAEDKIWIPCCMTLLLSWKLQRK